jgi:hypothetical protein
MAAIDADQTLVAAYDALSAELEAGGQSALADEYRRKRAEIAN